MGSITTTETVPRTVETTINYYLKPDHDGEDTFIPGTAGFHRRKYNPKTVKVEDIRDREEDFTLSKNGFQLIKHDLDNSRFEDQEKIKDMYPEVEKAMKAITGASRTKVFSHIPRTVTKQDLMKEIEAKKLADNDPFSKTPPVHYAHVDQGDESANLLLDQIFGDEEAAQLRKHRWAVVNFWKPVAPVLRDPLAVSDFSSLADDDFVPVYATPQGSTYGNFSGAKSNAGKRFAIMFAKENPNHRWYYASRMQPDEALLLKIYDTKKSGGGKAQRTMHSAFSHKETEDAPPRQSVEFRTMLFWEDEDAE